MTDEERIKELEGVIKGAKEQIKSLKESIKRRGNLRSIVAPDFIAQGDSGHIGQYFLCNMFSNPAMRL